MSRPIKRRIKALERADLPSGGVAVVTEAYRNEPWEEICKRRPDLLVHKGLIVQITCPWDKAMTKE